MSDARNPRAVLAQRVERARLRYRIVFEDMTEVATPTLRRRVTNQLRYDEGRLRRFDSQN